MDLLQLPQSTLSDRRIRLEFQHSGRYKIVFSRFKFCNGCGTDKIAQYICAGSDMGSKVSGSSIIRIPDRIGDVYD